jgi:uncharacterized protein (DUF983 family)
MKITRATMIGHGLRGHCPNCGGRTISQPGTLFKINPSCAACGLPIERGEGAFLGPLVVNYAVTVFGLVAPVIVLYACGLLSSTVTLSLAVVLGLGGPVLLYRISWAWWLTIYYFFLPENLPANLAGAAGTDE